MAKRTDQKQSFTAKTHHIYFPETCKQFLYNTSRPSTRTLECHSGCVVMYLVGTFLYMCTRGVSPSVYVFARTTIKESSHDVV